MLPEALLVAVAKLRAVAAGGAVLPEALLLAAALLRGAAAKQRHADVPALAPAKQLVAALPPVVAAVT